MAGKNIAENINLRITQDKSHSNKVSTHLTYKTIDEGFSMTQAQTEDYIQNIWNSATSKEKSVFGYAILYHALGITTSRILPDGSLEIFNDYYIGTSDGACYIVSEEFDGFGKVEIVIQTHPAK